MGVQGGRGPWGSAPLPCPGAPQRQAEGSLSRFQCNCHVRRREGRSRRALLGPLGTGPC